MKPIKAFAQILRENAEGNRQFQRYLEDPNPLYAVLRDENVQIAMVEELRARTQVFVEGEATLEDRTRTRNLYRQVRDKYRGCQLPEHKLSEPYIDFKKSDPQTIGATLSRFLESVDPFVVQKRAIIERAISRGIVTGEYAKSPEAARRVYQGLLTRMTPENRQIFEALEGEPELQAAAIYLLDSELEKTVGDYFEQLFRITLEGSRKAGKRKASYPTADYVCGGAEGPEFLSPEIEQLLSLIKPEKPTNQNNDEMQRNRLERLQELIDVKVERETFGYFKDDPQAGLSRLSAYTDRQTNPNIRGVCNRLRTLYEESLELDLPFANSEFLDPRTGKKGTLPSIHQRLGIHRIVKSRSLGIFDGPGTGKTAQAALAFPLIQGRLEQQERKMTGRAVVVCPNESKGVWQTALAGEKERRVFKDPVRSLAVVNGEKDLEAISRAQWVVLNYEQLPTRVEYEGQVMPFAEYLTSIGFDYLVLDEVHEVKSQRDTTPTGDLTYSAACRLLTGHAHKEHKYLSILSGTPIMDKMEDYAVLYHMLDPESLPDPTRFRELYQNNPRSLSTLVRRHTVRRRAEDINAELQIEDLEMSWNPAWEMDEKQRTVYEHIISTRRRDWLSEARKALLDPRLVDPQLLASLGIESIGIENSAKYRWLADLLTAPDGPVSRGEKTVVFSSEFKRGVTRVHEELEERYRKEGLSTEGLRETLADYLKSRIRAAFGVEREVLILDGDVPIEDRTALLERFHTGIAPVLICTTDTGGQSIDLTCASYAFHLDEDYSPGITEQANRRLARPGQLLPVHIGYLRLPGTIDDDVAEYVERKRIIQQMVMDGHPPTPEEEAILGDDSLLRERIKRRFGGVSIDLTLAVRDLALDADSIVVKRGFHEARARELTRSQTGYESTLAQQLRALIMQDPQGCWHDPSFVERYLQALPELSVYVVQRAKLVDLARRGASGSIPWPRRVLAEGSGPGLLYSAYQDMVPLLDSLNLPAPIVIDRDASHPMLLADPNPRKVRGCMTGKDSCIVDESVDMVDHESLTLLRNENDVKAALVEANRVLRPGGTLELTIKNYRFVKDFHTSLERLGFETLTPRNESLAPSRKLMRRLRERYGDHYASAFENKLSNTYLLIARKQAAPDLSVPARNFWFDHLDARSEPQAESSIEKAIACEIPVGTGTLSGNGNLGSGYVYKVDSHGVVVSVERVR